MSNENFDINDIFGQMPGRPQSADFWRISQLLLQLSQSVDDYRSQHGADQVNVEIARHADVEAATYSAMQRAMRPLGVTTAGEMMANMRQLSIFSTLWLEGFIIGNRFAEAGGHQGETPVQNDTGETRFWINDSLPEEDGPYPFGADTVGIVDSEEGGTVAYCHKDKAAFTLMSMRSWTGVV